MDSKRNKFWFGLIAIGLPLVLLAQAIRWYNDAAIPQKTTLAGNEVVSIQQTGPNAYRWAFVSAFRDYIGGTPGSPVTNFYVTILNVQSNAYFSNQVFITELHVTSNAYFTNNVFMYSTQFVNYSFTTNLTVNEFHGKVNFTTNVFFDVLSPREIAWAGPTNTLDFSTGSLQTYSTLVPISVTNVIGETNGYGNDLLLQITNTSGSNIGFTFQSGWKTGRGDPTSCTNGGVFQAWFNRVGNMKTIATKEYP